jgi:hypothetical protein
MDPWAWTVIIRLVLANPIPFLLPIYFKLLNLPAMGLDYLAIGVVHHIPVHASK